MLYHLWVNQSGQSFQELALISGAAVNARGQSEASMGVTVGEINQDGALDVFVTHLDGESNTLYINDGAGGFSDQSIRSGVAQPSINFTGFGTVFVDVDNDGALDLLSVNGAVKSLPQLREQGAEWPYGQSNQLFINRQGIFEDVSAKEPDLDKLEVIEEKVSNNLQDIGRNATGSHR